MRSLLQALLTTGGATIVAQLLGLLVNKILAVGIGAGGIGFYSLLRQAHDTAVGLGGIGAGGLVQGLAGREGSARTRLWWGAIALTALGAVAAGALLLVANRPIARLLFDRDDEVAAMAVALCAFTVMLGILYATLSAGVNAARAIAALALLGVGGAAVAALLAWPVAQAAQAAQARPAALVLLIGAPLAVQAIAAFLVLRRLRWLPDSPRPPQARPGRAEFAWFGGFFGFNVVLMAASTVALLFIRTGVVHQQGLAAAGLFAAGWGLGMQSMSLLLSAFGTYILPSLAAADAETRRKLLQDAATLMLALSLPLLVALIAWKPLVLRALFTAEFLPAVTLLQFLLLGNWLKLLSWVFATPFLATADLRRYLVMELAWYAVLVAGAAIALARGEALAGIGIAFCAAYAVYLALTAWMAHRRFAFRLSRRSTACFLAGAALLLATAALTWNAQAMDWPVALLAPMAALVLSALCVTPQHRARGWAMLRRGGVG